MSAEYNAEYVRALERAVARLLTEIRYGTVQGIAEVAESVSADLAQFAGEVR